jgi:hypothetical protein
MHVALVQSSALPLPLCHCRSAAAALPLPLLCDAALFALRSRTLHVLQRSAPPSHIPHIALCNPIKRTLSVCAALCTMASMSKPSKPSETHGGAPPPTWSSERWCARNPSCAVPNYQTTSTELFKRAGKQFKRKHPGKHEERTALRQRPQIRTRTSFCARP